MGPSDDGSPIHGCAMRLVRGRGECKFRHVKTHGDGVRIRSRTSVASHQLDRPGKKRNWRQSADILPASTPTVDKGNSLS